MAGLAIAATMIIGIKFQTNSIRRLLRIFALLVVWTGVVVLESLRGRDMHRLRNIAANAMAVRVIEAQSIAIESSKITGLFYVWSWFSCVSSEFIGLLKAKKPLCWAGDESSFGEASLVPFVISWMFRDDSKQRAPKRGQRNRQEHVLGLLKLLHGFMRCALMPRRSSNRDAFSAAAFRRLT